MGLSFTDAHQPQGLVALLSDGYYCVTVRIDKDGSVLTESFRNNEFPGIEDPFELPSRVKMARSRFKKAFLI